MRSLLHGAGLRFRVDHAIPDGLSRPVRPDIAFTRARLAVFIDGCFWHGCPAHGRRQTSRNSSYWGPKIERNRQRDEEQRQRLEQAGWTVLRFWEHEDPERVAQAIARVLRRAVPA